MTPLKFVIAILVFWLAFGGLLQLFDLTNETTGNSINPDTDSKVGTFKFIFNMMTFNVTSFPTSLSVILTTFFGASLGLSLYVLIRGQ